MQFPSQGISSKTFCNSSSVISGSSNINSVSLKFVPFTFCIVSLPCERVPFKCKGFVAFLAGRLAGPFMKVLFFFFPPVCWRFFLPLCLLLDLGFLLALALVFVFLGTADLPFFDFAVVTSNFVVFLAPICVLYSFTFAASVEFFAIFSVVTSTLFVSFFEVTATISLWFFPV